jgi:hypothetical protein
VRARRPDPLLCGRPHRGTGMDRAAALRALGEATGRASWQRALWASLPAGTHLRGWRLPRHQTLAPRQLFFARPTADGQPQRLGVLHENAQTSMRADALGPRRLRIGAVATVAAVGTDELAMEAVHLRATDLAVFTRRFQYLGGLRLLCTLCVHFLKYTVRPRQRRR